MSIFLKKEKRKKEIYITYDDIAENQGSTEVQSNIVIHMGQNHFTRKKSKIPRKYIDYIYRKASNKKSIMEGCLCGRCVDEKLKKDEVLNNEGEFLSM